MNEVSLFFGGLTGAEGPEGRRAFNRDVMARLDIGEDDLVGFQALFASLAEGGFASQAQTILRALGLDEAASRRVGAALGTGESSIHGEGPIRDVTMLHPHLRETLERVRSRMLKEHGHTVNIVETHRTPERQIELYAQGRTEPGPVVTWTQNSKHTHGMAVDVIVDGNYDNVEAYERLQRIAQEEGLHTLGMADAGHLELPFEWVEKAVRAHRQATGGMAPVAPVAAVAQVAVPGAAAPPQPVVPVAPHVVEAPVSPFGDPAPQGELPAAPNPAIEVEAPDFPREGRAIGDAPKIPVAAPELGKTADRAATIEDGIEAEIRSTESSRVELKPETRPGNGQRGQGQLDDDRPSREGRREASTQVVGETPGGRGEPVGIPEGEVPEGEVPDDEVFRIDRRPEVSRAAAARQASSAEGVTRSESVNATEGQTSVERAQQVQDLQLDSRARRVSRLVVEVPDGADSVSKIDVTARGDRINARIDASVTNLADQLRTHIADLQTGLAERGLQAESILIRESQAMDALRAAAASASSIGGTSEASGSGNGRGANSEQGPRDQAASQRDAQDARSERERNQGRDEGKRRQQ